jgi:hypothetical protein
MKQQAPALTNDSAQHESAACSSEHGSLPSSTAQLRMDGSPRQLAQRGRLAQLRSRASQRNRTGLPDPLKAGIEGLSGLSMDDVHVHYNSPKPAQLNALAYAQGSEIYLSPGQQHHLAHEAWHTVQQMQGRVSPTVQVNGAAINDDKGLEKEADRMGSQAMNGHNAAQGLAQLKGTEAPVANVAQCVRGGIEYTEDMPTSLGRFLPPAAPVPGGATVDRIQLYSIGGAQISVFAIASRADLGAQQGSDQTLFQSNQVKLTNDVVSAEWIIERHGADVPAATMRTDLRNDVASMFTLREQLAGYVQDMTLWQEALFARPMLALAPGSHAHLHQAPYVFVYRPGANKGKAQITVQYSALDAIKRINLLNASKFQTGTKVAVGEDKHRIAGTESATLLTADAAGTTAFSSAQVLLTALEGSSHAIPEDALPGAMLPAALRLSSQNVALIKLMAINDAMATTMVRYAARLGQAQEKNVQRLFPKSRRDEYTRAVAGANLSAGEMAALRAEINRTAAADAQLAFNGADPGALLVDETFNALGIDHVDMMGMVTARGQLEGRIPGAPAAVDLLNIKTHILGPNGAVLATWIARAANAYTDTSASVAGPHAGNNDHYQAGVGGAGTGPGNVIRSTEGFTPVAGGNPGAVYEFRERETAIDESGWLNIGSRAELEATISALFGAA